MSYSSPALLIPAIAILAVSGCVQVEMPGAGGINPTPPRAGPGQRPPAPDRPQQPIRQKRVERKESPTTLIANDGAWCTVSEERFQMIKVGDNAWCAWAEG